MKQVPTNDPMRTETDVLVIGSGAAGMYAAIEAARAGCSVLLADRSLIGRGGLGRRGLQAEHRADVRVTEVARLGAHHQLAPGDRTQADIVQRRAAATG